VSFERGAELAEFVGITGPSELGGGDFPRTAVSELSFAFPNRSPPLKVVPEGSISRSNWRHALEPSFQKRPLPLWPADERTGTS